MLGEIGLRGVFAEQGLVGIDDKRGSPLKLDTLPLGAEHLADLALWIRQQGEVEIVLVGKTRLGLHVIAGDSDSMCSEGAELGRQVAKATTLDRSAGGEGLGVEVENNRPGFEQAVQTDLITFLIKGSEVRNRFADFHGAGS